MLIVSKLLNAQVKQLLTKEPRRDGCPSHPIVHRCNRMGGVSITAWRLLLPWVAALFAPASLSSLETIRLDQVNHLKLFSTCRGSSDPLSRVLPRLHLKNYSSWSDSPAASLKLLCAEARRGLFHHNPQQRQQRIPDKFFTSLPSARQPTCNTCYLINEHERWLLSSWKDKKVHHQQKKHSSILQQHTTAWKANEKFRKGDDNSPTDHTLHFSIVPIYLSISQSCTKDPPVTRLYSAISEA